MDLWENNFFRLIILIIIVFLGVKLSTIKTNIPANNKNNNPITSERYLNETISELRKNKSIIEERNRLGLESSSKDFYLITWKIHILSMLQEPGIMMLDEPCDNYCENLRYRDEEKAIDCSSKYWLKCPYGLSDKYEAAMNAYKKGTITKEEMKNIREDLIHRNQLVINEINKIVELEEIPKSKPCTEADYEKTLD